MSQAAAVKASNVNAAVRHARLRWAGAPLLLAGVVLFGLALLQVARGGVPWFAVMVGLFGVGLGLASFGANHDSAMALALRAERSELPRGMQQELDEELERDRAGTMSMKATPRIAMALPLFAGLVQCGLGYWLMG